MNDALCKRLESIYGMSVEELLSKPTVHGRDQEARPRLKEANAVEHHRRSEAIVANLNENVRRSRTRGFSEYWYREMIGPRVLKVACFERLVRETVNEMREIVGQRTDANDRWESLDREYPEHLTRQMWFKFDIPYYDL